MSKVLVTESHLEDIADAIRAKLGVATEYKPGQMATAIGTIPTGITPTGTISITQNGTVDVTNYASASVNVSGGGGGKMWFDANNVTVTPSSAAQTDTDGLIYTVLQSSSGDASGSAWVVNSNSSIDLTNIGKIYVCVFLGEFETNVSNPFVGVASQQISSFDDMSQCAVSSRFSSTSSSGSIIKLDVSSLSGSYYLVASGKLTYGSYGWVRTKFAAIAV